MAKAGRIHSQATVTRWLFALLLTIGVIALLVSEISKLSESRSPIVSIKVVWPQVITRAERERTILLVEAALKELRGVRSVSLHSDTTESQITAAFEKTRDSVSIENEVQTKLTEVQPQLAPGVTVTAILLDDSIERLILFLESGR